MKIKFMLLFSLAVVLLLSCQSAELTSAKVYVQQNNYPSALEQLKIAMQKEPANAEVFYMAGKIYAEMDSFDQMNESFNRALELDSTLRKDIRAWRIEKRSETFEKGIRAGNSKNWDKAIELTKTSLRIDPEFFDGWANLGYYYQQKNDYENAIFAYNRAYGLDSLNTSIAKQVAVDYFNSGRVPEAIAVLEKIVEKGKPDAMVYVYLSQMYTANNDPEKSDIMLNKAIELDPNNPELIFEAGLAKFFQKKYDDAIFYFKRVLELKPGDRDALYNLSISQFNAEKYDDAVASAELLVKNNPQDAPCWEQFGYCLMRAGQAEKGKSAISVSEAIAKAKENKHDEVISTLEPIIKKYPEWCGPWMLLKVSYVAKNDKAGSEKAQKGIDSCGK